MNLNLSKKYLRFTCSFLSVLVGVSTWGMMARNARADQPNTSAKVLRHAVFFSFKETASDADVSKVADAFAALPSKIDAIEDFEWGTNVGDEKRSGGFTHAFLLSFDDEAGRAEYLPHPEHKAFGNVLRPHMKDVFVIDYWAQVEPVEVKDPLRHVVFFKFKKDASQDAIKQAESVFSQLPSQIDSIKGLEWGTNNSPERHDDGFTHCFLVTFENQAGLKSYGPHSAHQALVKILGPILDEVRVIDFVAK